MNAVLWQRRYSKPLPNGSMAEWHEISEAEYVGRRFDYYGHYEYRALCVLPEGDAP